MRTMRFMLAGVVFLVAAVATLMYGVAALSYACGSHVDWADWTGMYLVLIPLLILTGGFYGWILEILSVPAQGRKAVR